MMHHPHVLTGAHLKSSRNKSRDSQGPHSQNTSMNAGMHIYTRGSGTRKHIQIGSGSQSTKHSSNFNSNTLIEGAGGFASSRGSAVVHHPHPVLSLHEANQNSGVRSHSANSFPKKQRAPSTTVQPMGNLTNHPTYIPQFQGSQALAPPPSIGGPRRPSLRKIDHMPSRNRISLLTA